MVNKREKIPSTKSKLFHKIEIGFARSRRSVVVMESIITKPSKVEGDDDLVHYLRTLQLPLASLIRSIEGESSATSRKRSRDEKVDNDEKTKNPSSPVCSYLAIDDSGRALVLAAHRELLRHEASLSTNKRSAPAIELLLRASSAAQLTRFGASLLPYLRFLSTNRHASHVLQSFLSLSNLILSGQRSISEAECELDNWDAPVSSSGGSTTALMQREFEIPAVGAIPSVSISLISPADVMNSLTSLIKVWALTLSSSSETLRDILYDSGGTHVLRAMVGVLTGAQTESLLISNLPVDESGVLTGENEVDEVKGAGSALDSVSFKGRGRAKKGKKNVVGSGGQLQVLVTSNVSLSGSSDPRGSSDHRGQFKEVFIRLVLSVLSLSTSNAEELGALGCDVNASATLQLMIKASSLVAPNICKVLCRRVSNWGLEGLTKEEISGKADLTVSDEVVGKEEEVEIIASSSKRKSKSRKQARAKAQIDATIDNGDATNHWLYRLCANPIGSRLVECLLTFADPPLFHAFIESFFKGNMNELCADPYGNFSVQKLLVGVPESMKSRDVSDTLLMEVSSCIGLLCDQRKSGVLLHVAAAAAGAPPALVSSTSIEKQEEISKHNSHISYRNQHAPAASESVQGEIITALLAVSKRRHISSSLSSGASTSCVIKNDPSLARLILNLPEQVQTQPLFRGSSSHPALPTGPVTSSVFSLTYAHLLRFSLIHSRVILDSLLSLTPYEIASLATDPTASRHILEPLFELHEGSVSSLSVLSSEHCWAKNKLHSLLRGYFSSLAVTRFGSWVVSKAFVNLDVKRKASIASELVEGESRLRGGGSGAQISALLKMVRIEQFKTNRIGWEAHWVKEEMRKREILESVGKEVEVMGSLNGAIMKGNKEDVVEARDKVKVIVKEAKEEEVEQGSITRGKKNDETRFEEKRVVSKKLAPHLKALGF